MTPPVVAIAECDRVSRELYERIVRTETNQEWFRDSLEEIRAGQNKLTDDFRRAVRWVAVTALSVAGTVILELIRWLHG